MSQNITKQDLLLLLLYSKGRSIEINEPVQGITRLMKLIFLVEKRIQIVDKFNFVPYKLGPYSSEIYSALEFFQNIPTPEDPVVLSRGKTSDDELQNLELLKFNNDADGDDPLWTATYANKEYALSKTGLLLAKRVWEEAGESIQNSIQSIKQEFGGLTLRELLKYVYGNYPEMTSQSIIKDEVNEY